jgi:hypothetical protein
VRALLNEARAHVPAGEPPFAAVAPGDAASLRALLAAGFTPIGSVLLIRPGKGAEAQPQPQAPPQQPPPDAPAATPDPARPVSARPVRPTVGSRRTVSSWPSGHGAGSSARSIGRLISKVVPHARHRTSYLGTSAPVLRTLLRTT